MPVRLDRAWGEVEHVSRLLEGQPAEEAQLDHPGRALVELPQRLELLVQIEHVHRPLVAVVQSLVERHPGAVASALARTLGPRVVDQDLAHGVGRHRKELSAILPVEAGLLHEPQEDLVDERGGLERVLRTLTAHLCPGDATQLSLDEGKQVVQGALAVVARTLQERGDLGGRGPVLRIGAFVHGGRIMPSALEVVDPGEPSVDRNQLDRIRELFDGARELSGGERDAWLRAECGDDEALRSEVDSLLAEYDTDGSMLEPGGDTALLRRWVTEAAETVQSGDGPPFEVPGYRILFRLGEGAQGAVYEAEQDRPRRTVALKLLRPQLGSTELSRRFEREAQTLARLSHPGIAVVHGSGVVETDFGPLPYFAMELVRGEPLTRFAEARGLDRNRRIELLADVCDAVAHAHERGVVHRDLKPSNILVEENGRTRVLDFGVARVLGQDVEAATLETRTGQVLGTLAYMSPEQASGRPQEVDQRADVFALGVLLFELLTGSLPRDLDGRPLPEQVRILAEGETSLLGTVDRALRGDLETIAAKAMAMERERRYADAGRLADDLRRYLRSEPIAARPATTWYFVGRFVRRNKGLSASLATAAAALVVGTVVSLWLFLEASRGRDEVLRLSGLQVHDELMLEARALWPPHPEVIEPMEAWLAEARDLLAELPVHRATLARLRDEALPWTEADRTRDRETHPRWEELRRKDTDVRAYYERKVEEGGAGASAALERLVGEVQELERLVDARRTWAFDRRETSWQHDTLVELIGRIEALEEGLLSKSEEETVPDHGWSVPRRLAFARRMEEGFAPAGAHARRWAESLPEISAAYPGLGFQMHVGLVPLGPDPDSGLWEFVHLMTGDVPERGPDGRLILREETGLVLVLIPAGRFWMGSQRTDPQAPGYDPWSVEGEGPVREVEVSAFLLSKYEMTQAQWQRLTGFNPSDMGPHRPTVWDPNWLADGKGPSLLHPVEFVSHDDCTTWLPRADLVLPSEAQWEYACRAGTGTPFWTGSDDVSLEGAANLHDVRAQSTGTPNQEALETLFDDGASIHWPVGSGRANPFGLHDVHGNLWEWCLDEYGDLYYRWAPTVDPVALGFGGYWRVLRGGSHNNMAWGCRSSKRHFSQPENADWTIGVRPAMAIGE